MKKIIKTATPKKTAPKKADSKKITPKIEWGKPGTTFILMQTDGTHNSISVEGVGFDIIRLIVHNMNENEQIAEIFKISCSLSK